MAKHPHRRGKSHKRRSDYLEIRNRILIICEGQKTEPNYFRRFPQSKVFAVTVHGAGMNTDALVIKALEKKQEAIRKQVPYNEVWCVFDRDSFTPDHFNRALDLGESRGIRIAYSNQAFELWYLLHFDFHTSSIDRKRYAQMLSERLRIKYKKNHAGMYDALLPKQKDAIRNAEKLLQSHKGKHPCKCDPSTTVHHLVCRLNQMV